MVLPVIETLNANIKGEFLEITQSMTALENRVISMVSTNIEYYRVCLKSVSRKFQANNDVFLPEISLRNRRR